MDKREFLQKLRVALDGLPENELEERLLFYGEMIDDRMDEGKTEERAVAELGTVEDVAAQIVSEIPFSKIVKEKVKRKRKMQGWEIAFLTLGSPVWLSLLVAVVAVVLALYACVWAVVVSAWAVDVAFVGAAFGLAVCGIAVIGQGGFLQAVLAFGVACLSAGLAIFGYFACVKLAKLVCVLTKKALVGVKTRLVRKEKNNG
jgi:uncharacterized membrane protein